MFRFEIKGKTNNVLNINDDTDYRYDHASYNIEIESPYITLEHVSRDWVLTIYNDYYQFVKSFFAKHSADRFLHNNKIKEFDYVSSSGKSYKKKWDTKRQGYYKI